MKSQNFIKVLFVLIFSIVLISCAKSEKDKVIAYNNDITEWVSSDGFLNELKEKVKTPEGIFQFLEQKRNEIAQKNGFKDYVEAENVIKKYANDEDMRQSLADREAKFSQAMTEKVTKIQEELIKATNPVTDAIDEALKDTSVIKEGVKNAAKEIKDGTNKAVDEIKKIGK